MRRFALTAILILLAGTSCISAGAAERRTIEIQATAKVEVAAEIATVKIGYLNHAPTKDAVYAENTRLAQKIVQALLDAHVPKSAIETQAIALEREEQNAGTSASKVLQYSASQEWRVHVAAADAQRIVEIAIAAGANNVEGVDWDVKIRKRWKRRRMQQRSSVQRKSPSKQPRSQGSNWARSSPSAIS